MRRIGNRYPLHALQDNGPVGMPPHRHSEGPLLSRSYQSTGGRGSSGERSKERWIDLAIFNDFIEGRHTKGEQW